MNFTTAEQLLYGGKIKFRFRLKITICLRRTIFFLIYGSTLALTDRTQRVNIHPVFRRLAKPFVDVGYQNWSQHTVQPPLATAPAYSARLLYIGNLIPLSIF
jgi:hypothetical protein